jgi:hypothetical protein
MDIRQILKNGDICELEYQKGVTFGLYMDGYLYKNQDNDVMCQIGGFEPMVIRVVRPSSMRNAFELFRYANNYNFSYEKYGKFNIVYSK